MHTIHGVIHGKTIELTDDPGLGEGVEVEVIVRPAPSKQPHGEGLRRSADAMADSWTAEDDEILADIAKDRERSTDRELPE
jgi:hypothetical protein